MTAKSVTLLGATGSIGCSTLDVVQASDGQLRVAGLTANSRLDALCQQAETFRPDWIVATDAEKAAAFDWSGKPESVELLVGHQGIETLVPQHQIDTVVAAMVGSIGLTGTWAALEAGKTVALANKETLVMAGPLVMQLAKRSGAKILPVDSEHSAVFQALESGRPNDVKRIILTASGGPFRQYTADQLTKVTVDEALAHPTCNMGPKITVESATMMNKAHGQGNTLLGVGGRCRGFRFGLSRPGGCAWSSPGCHPRGSRTRRFHRHGCAQHSLYP